MDFYLNLLQWPAMFATVISTWLVTSKSKNSRKLGFGFFIISNFLWVIWGWSTAAYAVILMQLILFGLNLRGLTKNN